MNARCNRPRYVERGIEVCDEWRGNPAAFMAWALVNGYADDLTLDRIDNNGPYAPYNCRWVTTLQQNRNKNTNRVVTDSDGISHCLSEWAEITGLKPETIRRRLLYGWSEDAALYTPVTVQKKRGNRHEKNGNGAA